MRKRGSGPSDWPAALPLASVVVLAVVMYSPALASPFVSDDYAFLWVARDLSGDELVRSLLADPDVRWKVVSFSWRPLSLLAFTAVYQLFGAWAPAFHAVLLAGHLVSIALVWHLARRLVGGWLGPTVAIVVFGLHPLTHESVTWIASINSLALPVALGAWAILHGEEDGPPPWIHATTAAVVFALAVGFRETIVVMLVPMLGVQLIRSATTPWMRTLVRLTPLLALPGAVAAISKAATAGTGYGELTIGGAGRRYWVQLERALVPVLDPGSAAVGSLQTIGAVVLVALPLALLARRQWIALVLAFSFHASVLVSAVTFDKVAARYLYFPLALLGLALASVVGRNERLLPRPTSGWVRVAAVALIVITAAGAATMGRRSVVEWAGAYPQEYEQLRRQMVALSDEIEDGDSILYSNLPLSIGLYDGHNVRFVADHVWPGRAVSSEIIAIEAIAGRTARLRPGEHLVVYDPSWGECALRRSSGPRPTRTLVYEIAPRPGTGATTSAPLVRIGPYDGLWASVTLERDGSRHRSRVEIPWLPPIVSEWRSLEQGDVARVAVTPALDGDRYEVLVDGVAVADLDGSTTDASGAPVAAELVPQPLASPPASVAIRSVVASPCEPEEQR